MRIYQGVIFGAVVAMCISGCSSTPRGDVRARGAEMRTTSGQGEVAAALKALAATGADVKITISQSVDGTAATRTATGTGAVDYRRGASSVLFTLDGAGSTDARQAGSTLFLKSFNGKADEATANWVAVPENKLKLLLDWPSSGSGEPGYLFATSLLPSMLATSVGTPKAIARVGGLTQYYGLLHPTGPASPSLERPRVDFWVSDQGWLEKVRLDWPTVNNEQPSGQPFAPEPAASEQGSITVEMALTQDGDHVNAQSPTAVATVG